ncbi:hypothetical protein OAA24_00040 [bacterium]|nr:hypothetical protein [bacterium]
MPVQDQGLGHRPQTKKAMSNKRGAIGNLSFPATGLAHSIMFVFKEYSYEGLNAGFDLLTGSIGQTGRARGSSIKGISSIQLPFPRALTDSTGVVIQGFERDKTTEAISRAATNVMSRNGGMTISDIPRLIREVGAGGSNLLTGGGGDGESAVGKLVKSILGTDLGDATTGAQYLLRSKLPGDIGRSIDITTGQTVNPRETLSFDGVELRTHTFNWDLYPESQEDSRLIKEVVNGFKKQILPHTRDIEGIPRAFLTYPATVDTYLLGVNPEHFIKFKTSLVRSIDVDYGAGGGVTMMKGGKPGGVSLSISMQELEIQTADEYGGTLVQEDPAEFVIPNSGAQ